MTGWRSRSFTCTVTALVVLASTCATGRAAAAKLLLAVVFDGQSTGIVAPFLQLRTQLFTTVGNLLHIGLRVPAALRAQPRRSVALSTLKGVTFHYDRATQTLIIQQPHAHEHITVIEAGPAPSQRMPVRAGTGVTLNYDASAFRTWNGTGVASQLGLRAFSPHGTVSSDWLELYGPPTSYYARAVRLDTTYTWSNPRTLRQVLVGDLISQGPTWVRALRLGGFGISSDFALRPDLVTFPVPSFSGSVTVPSTVSLMVNDSQLLSRPVPAGPFAIAEIPVVTGAGRVSMTVTNALGQRSRVTLPFYASRRLLAAGLQSYSFEAGWIRRQWGLLSNDYGPFAAYATWRRGLTDYLTVEAHAQTTPGLFMSGVGGAVRLGTIGIATASLAVSGGPRGPATQYAISIGRRARRLSFGLSLVVAGAAFQDVAAVNGEPVPRKQLYATLGTSLGRYGNLGVAYAGLDQPAAPSGLGPAPAAQDVPPAPLTGTVPARTGETRVRILSMNYAVNVHNMSFYVVGFKDFGGATDSGVTVGLTISLGARRSASADEQWVSSHAVSRIQLMQNASQVGQWGYHIYSTLGSPAHQFADVRYDAPWAVLSAGADNLAGRTTTRVAARGAVSLLDHAVFFSNYINDSFAVADTDGVANVTVYDENRRVGRTNADGLLLVPDLRAFQINHLTINPDDVPPSFTIPFASRNVIPQERAGIVVRFPLKASHGALLKLVGAAGKPLPIGSIARLKATGKKAMVGYGGEAYFEGLSRENYLTVESPHHRYCFVRFAYRSASGSLPTIGPLTCRRISRP